MYGYSIIFIHFIHFILENIKHEIFYQLGIIEIINFRNIALAISWDKKRFYIFISVNISF